MLRTDTVCLRPPEDRDLDFFVALRNDVDLQLSLMARPRASSATKVRNWLTARGDDAHGLFFVIATPDNERAAGFIQLTNMDEANGTADLGICVGPAYQGRGLARAALQALEDYAQAVFGLRKVVLKVLASNATAIALYDKAGYRKVGLLEQHHYQQGTYQDVVIMEKLLKASAS